MIKHKNIIRFVKAHRLNWLGHIERMPEERVVKKINNWKPIALRPIGRPKNRWDDDVRKDLKIVRVYNWKDVQRIGINGSQLLSGPRLLRSCSTG
jgi:hypothetical protein